MKSAEMRPDVEPGEFVIMPDYVQAILPGVAPLDLGKLCGKAILITFCYRWFFISIMPCNNLTISISFSASVL